MEAEILEILIGKYIDGEITPSEQEMLDEELERDFEAREFIKQLQELDKQSRETVSSEVVGHGRDVSVLFERAWQRCRNPVFRFLTPASGWFRFATGLAAGLLIGIGLHFVLAGEAATPSGVQGQAAAVQAPQVPGGVQASSVVDSSKASTKTVRHNVDWFSFTDKSGDQWIVEGLRKDVVRPASYSKEL
jgi:anti-sigma factor RsiW